MTAWYDTHITQGFFWANVPSNQRGQHGTINGHSGIDLAENNGTPLTSAVTGRVIHAGAHKWGGEVDIQFIAGNQTFVLSYLHLSAIYVSTGQSVQTGQLIGLSGGASWSSPIPTLCCSTGPHLHFELTLGPLAPYSDYSPQHPTTGSHPIDPTDFWNTIKTNGLANDQSALAGAQIAAGTGVPSADGSLEVAYPSNANGTPSAYAAEAMANVPGFDGIVMGLDRVETFTPYTPPSGLASLNPFSDVGYGFQWIHDNGIVIMVRGTIIAIGFVMFLLILLAIVRKPAVAALEVGAQVAPLVM